MKKGPVGASVAHESAALHVTGQAQFTDDIWPTHGNVVHLWPVCSTQAHAQIERIETATALKLPGVLDVMVGTDVPGDNDIGPARRDEPLLPVEMVSHWGQAVAWVVAETECEAKRAAQKVSVQYRPLPAVLTLKEAIAAGSFHTETLELSKGDAPRALGRAAHRISGELWVGGQEHFYLETQAAFAIVDSAGHVMVHSSTQHPAETQKMVARVLGLTQNQVTVQCLRMGGAFGGKEVQANAWAAIAALCAQRLGRPARVRLTRQQDMCMTGKRHPFVGKFEVGFDDTGKLLALRTQLYSDGGHCLDLSEPVLQRALFHSDSCYCIEHMQVSGRVCKTNTVSNTAFRGFGGPQGMLIMEEALDRVARSLGLPIDEVRARNFYRQGARSHFGQIIQGAERLPRLWSQLQQSSDYRARLGQISTFNSREPNKKRGLAITAVKFGISFTTAAFNQAGALVLIFRDGSVQVNHGGTEMGQGLHTKIRQIAAQQLGVPLAQVRIMATRTDKIPNTSATAASAGTDLNGAAVANACQVLRERLQEVAQLLHGLSSTEWVFQNGRIVAQNNPRADFSFVEVVAAAYQRRVALFATGFYCTPNIQFDWEQGQGTPFQYFAFGAAVSEVQVCGFTGQYQLRRVDILHDVGESLSPKIDVGQIEGGFIQGLGWLTTESLHWDKVGRLCTQGASTYKLPTVAECPPDFRVQLLAEARQEGVIFGSKAVGEPPFMLAISVREALRAAVGEFEPGSTRIELASPATPEQVYWAIDALRTARGSTSSSPPSSTICPASSSRSPTTPVQ